MKRLLKYFGLLLFVLIISGILFFFWASSPTLAEKEYAKIITTSATPTVDNDSIYSIITYNIGYLSGMTNNRAIAKPKSLFENNLKKVLDNFSRLNADIIAFQEIDYASARSYEVNQQNEIAKLGYPYVAQAVNWDETYVPFPYWPPSIHFGKMLSGQSILSKFPLTEHQRIVLERVKDNPFYRDALYLDRLAQVVKTTLGNKTVAIINVHLEAFDKPTRGHQFTYVLSLFKKLASKYPTILLGDFNSPARDKKAIVQRVFNMPSIGNAVFTAKNPINTFDTKKPFERIDYIFYTKNSIEYIDGKVLTQFGEASDHLPIEMRFRLK